MTDPHMKSLRHDINLIIEECALAAARGGPEEVRKLKIEETDELPERRWRANDDESDHVL